MIPYTDEELQDVLLYQGYRVPLIVIRSWGSPTSKGHGNRRRGIEAWLRFMMREKKSHFHPFPQVLAMFDITIRRRL